MTPSRHSVNIEELPLLGPTLQTFDCTLLSPLFMYGASKNYPELREESIIGTLHYWYRALWGHCRPLEEIRKGENELFGSTTQKGTGFIKIAHNISKENIEEKSFKPHRAADSKNSKKGIIAGTSFQITLSENLVELFQIAVILGGFGGRSRRGFGAVEITSPGSDSTTPLATNILVKLRRYLGNQTLIRSDFEEGIEKIILPISPIAFINKFPYLLAVYFNEDPNVQNPLTKINSTASKLTKTYGNLYDKQLGTFNQRFASPVIATLARDRGETVAVISQLYNTKSHQTNIQDEFIRTILTPQR